MRDPEERTRLLRSIEEFLLKAQGVPYSIVARTPGAAKLKLESEDAKAVLESMKRLLRDSLYNFPEDPIIREVL